MPNTSAEDLSPESTKILEERPMEEKVPLEVKNRKMLIVGIITFVVVLGLTGYVFYLTSQVKKTPVEEVKIANDESMELSPTEAVAKESLARDKIKLLILNGSGVSGAAESTADAFEKLGYQNIEVGNAELTSGHVVLVNSSEADLLENLLEDLKKELDVETVSKTLDDETLTAKIILGK